MLAALTAASNTTSTALHENNVKNFAIFLLCLFEDLLASITFAKNFGFLAVVDFKIFAIKNAFATNRNVNRYDCYVLNEILTNKKSIFADA